MSTRRLLLRGPRPRRVSCRPGLQFGYNGRMIERVSHSREDESIESKARWFQSLSLAERMQLLCEFTDLVFENNPRAAEAGRAESSTDGIRVLSVA